MTPPVSTHPPRATASVLRTTTWFQFERSGAFNTEIPRQLAAPSTGSRTTGSSGCPEKFRAVSLTSIACSSKRRRVPAGIHSFTPAGTTRSPATVQSPSRTRRSPVSSACSRKGCAARASASVGRAGRPTSRAQAGSNWRKLNSSMRGSSAASGRKTSETSRSRVALASVRVRMARLISCALSRFASRASSGKRNATVAPVCGSTTPVPSKVHASRPSVRCGSAGTKPPFRKRKPSTTTGERVVDQARTSIVSGQHLVRAALDRVEGLDVQRVVGVEDLAQVGLLRSQALLHRVDAVLGRQAGAW